MEFKDLIEARRSVRKYVASEISKAEVEAIVGEALPSFNVASADAGQGKCMLRMVW